jgi:hypothetical protein
VWPQCWDLQGPRGLEQRDLRNLHLGDLKKGPNGGVSPTPQKMPLPKHRTQTQNKHIHIPNTHALCGIRTHDPGFRASEDSTCRICFRPLGYRDRPERDIIIQFCSVQSYIHSLYTDYCRARMYKYRLCVLYNTLHAGSGKE